MSSKSVSKTSALGELKLRRNVGETNSYNTVSKWNINTQSLKNAVHENKKYVQEDWLLSEVKYFAKI